MRPLTRVGILLRFTALLCGAGVSATAAAAPEFRTDALEIELSPAAVASARASALAARRAGVEAAPRASLGIAALDRFARASGAAFEPVFAGEDPNDPEGARLSAWYRVRLPEGVPAGDALATLRATPEVAHASRIALLPVARVPNDSLWSVSTWFYQPSRADVHAPEAWDVTTGDSSVVVAIVDTGVLAWHPDLSGTLPSGPSLLWRNASEANGVAGVDDDGNGFVDDVTGWDFVSLATSAQAVAGEDWRDADADPNDFSGHGTEVASLVSALTDDGIGVAGTTWTTKLMALRIGWSAPSAPPGLVDMSYAASAIRYAARMGARVINCSFETLNQGGLLAAVDAATRAGALVVNAAGNSSPNIALAQREDVLAVGATDANDVVASFSNTGAYVDLCAPGVGLTAASVTHAGADSIGSRLASYATGSGTSLSAPIASGAAALLAARRIALGEPPLHPLDVIFRLRETADDVAAQNPGLTGYGTGRLNLERALLETHTSRVRRAGARTIGPAVVRARAAGGANLAFVTNNNRFLVLDGVTLDTLANAALPGRPARQLAAAAFGAGGVGYFTGTSNGRMLGLDDSGLPLAGWPYDAGDALLSFAAGPALGDLDGDGVLEIVCGASDGQLYAWTFDGQLVAGFPFSSGSASLAFPIALANLDGAPGDEIVTTASDGRVTVFGANGLALPGWPVTLTAPAPSTPPVVARLGSSPAILFGRGSEVRAYGADGSHRFTYASGVSLVQEPIAADLDGDGAREVACAGSTGATHRLATLDTLGNLRAGFPVTLAASVSGALLTGPLAAGAPRALGVMTAAGFAAYDGAGGALAGWPKPGLAGASATIAARDASGHAALIAGAGPDSLLYFYDAGPGSWAAVANAWATPRADFARTGSTLAPPPPLPPLDDAAPSAIADLRADSIGADGVALVWTAPGGDGALGSASGYELQLVTVRSDAGTFGNGVRTDLGAPALAGSAERFVVTGLASGVTYFIALRARDEAGNRGASSAVLAVTMPFGGARPFDGAGAGVRALASPGTAPFELRWKAAARASGSEHALSILDAAGRRVRRFALGRSDAGALQWDGRDAHGARVPAGLYFARLDGDEGAARARFVFLR